jgi:hypothetical protein
MEDVWNLPMETGTKIATIMCSELAAKMMQI